MSVQNQTSPYAPFIGGGIGIAFSAIAGALIGPPIGALGGALFAATSTITSNLVNYLSEEIIEVRSAAAKATIAFLGFVAAIAAGVGALSLAGFSFTASHIAILFGTTLLVGFVVSTTIACAIGAAGVAIAASARRQLLVGRGIAPFLKKTFL